MLAGAISRYISQLVKFTCEVNLCKEKYCLLGCNPCSPEKFSEVSEERNFSIFMVKRVNQELCQKKKQKTVLDPEDGGNMFLWIFCEPLQDYTPLHSRKLVILTVTATRKSKSTKYVQYSIDYWVI
jgi:hypothetical protein